jgi:hypothetical protein
MRNLIQTTNQVVDHTTRVGAKARQPYADGDGGDRVDVRRNKLPIPQEVLPITLLQGKLKADSSVFTTRIWNSR